MCVVETGHGMSLEEEVGSGTEKVLLREEWWLFLPSGIWMFPSVPQEQEG